MNQGDIPDNEGELPMPPWKKAERTREQQDKEKREKENTQIINVIVGILESNCLRQQMYADPVTRGLIFLEKLLCTIDILSGALNTVIDMELSADLKNRVDKLKQLFNDQIKLVINLIQQPHYSPDHPFGNKFMKEQQQMFTMHNTGKPDFGASFMESDSLMKKVENHFDKQTKLNKPNSKMFEPE